MDNILNTITAYREERKWSLYDLATHAEMKSTTISTWYNNNATPTIPSLVKICDAFQITLSEFFAKAEGSESTPVVLTPFSIMEDVTYIFHAPPTLPSSTKKGRRIMKKKLIEYKPSPGSQVRCRRLSVCSPALWCGDWLRCSVVGGLAYVL